MRIYDQNPAGSPAAAESARSQETQRPGRAGSPATGASAAGSGDQVQLSDTLNTLSQAMSAYSQSRSAKVQALAAQYQNGTYQADSLATSRGLIAEALTSGGR